VIKFAKILSIILLPKCCSHSLKNLDSLKENKFCKILFYLDAINFMILKKIIILEQQVLVLVINMILQEMLHAHLLLILIIFKINLKKILKGDSVLVKEDNRCK
jgi:hypothetical protein